MPARLAFMPGRGECGGTVEIEAFGPERERASRTRFRSIRPERRRSGACRPAICPFPTRPEKNTRLRRRFLESGCSESESSALEKAVRDRARVCAGVETISGPSPIARPKVPGCRRILHRALEADPAAYEPLVNLGSVLINLDPTRMRPAYNLHAVLKHPNDALANVSEGVASAGMLKLGLAEEVPAGGAPA